MTGASKLEQSFDFLVSGFVINDPSGPLCWAGWIPAKDWKEAITLAIADVASEEVNGMRGVLFVANVLQLNSEGMIEICNKDMVYGDDMDRKRGIQPKQGWKVPVGYEGYSN